MEKKVAGLIGAMSAFAVASPAVAMPAEHPIEAAMHVASYADLLKPVPNAASVLAATIAAEQAAPTADAADHDPAVQTVQWYDHHHHHHHRRPPPRRYHHHHHHHHHHHNNAARLVVPGLAVVLPR